MCCRSDKQINIIFQLLQEFEDVFDSGNDELKVDFLCNKLELLLMIHPDYARTTHRGNYPLHKAIWFCPLKAIKLIYNCYPGAIRKKDSRSRLPLELACEMPPDEVAWELIPFLEKEYPEAKYELEQKGRNLVNFIFQCRSNSTMGIPRNVLQALMIACPKNESAVVKYIIELFKARVQNLDALKFCLEQWREFPYHEIVNGRIPLHLACSYKVINVDEIKHLLNEAPVCTFYQDILGKTPLHLLLERRQYSNDLVNLVKTFLEHGATSILWISDKQGKLPIHTVCSKAQPSRIHSEDLELFQEIIRLLIEKAPDTIIIQDKMGHLPIHYLLSDTYPSIETIRTICKWTPEEFFSVQDSHGKTPLLLAMGDVSISCNRMQRIELVLKRLPEALVIQDHNGKAPLHYISEKARRDGLSVELLKKICQMKHIACIAFRLQDQCGRTPLHLALQTQNSSNELLDILVANTSVDVLDIKDDEGITPLLAACRSDRPLDLIYRLFSRDPIMSLMQINNEILKKL